MFAFAPQAAGQGDQVVLTNTPCFAITGPMKDLTLFLKLKATYGGWIRYKYKENAIVWTITARADLFKIIALLNGHLRSPKIYQFNLLIDYLNSLFPFGLQAPLVSPPLVFKPQGKNKASLQGIN